MVTVVNVAVVLMSHANAVTPNALRLAVTL